MSDREQQADQYAWTHGDSQTRADFLAGWDSAVRAGVVAEEPEWEQIDRMREARAETWDEAISAVFAWWSTPEAERPAAIRNPYGVVPANKEGD